MKGKGYILIELLLSIGISMIGLMAIYTLLFQGYRYLDTSEGGINMGVIMNRSRVRLGLERMLSEMKESSIDTVEISGTGDAISFASPRGLDGTPTTDGSWAKAIVYFLSQDKLFKYEEAKTDWSANFDPTLVFQDDRESSWVEIAGSIDELRFEKPANTSSVYVHIRTKDGLSIDTSLRMR